MDKSSRLELHEKLLELTKNVYFQPPANTSILYPCIVYQRIDIDTSKANNKNYIKHNSYQLTVMDLNPESSIPDSLMDKFSMISITSAYTVDNLHHTFFSLYYK